MKSILADKKITLPRTLYEVAMHSLRPCRTSPPFVHQLRPLRHPLLATLSALLITLFPFASHGASTVSDQDLRFLKQLSISELLELKVTSVSRQPQPISDTAAAVFVITGEDLHRSGATSIAEALRLVPGVQVARIDSNKWAISARGFNGRFANKLLVLQDGRRLYNSAYSGVFWDLQDTVLDNIDRIEVIRGPGAAMWGTNAVNGVINIITKPAEKTRGGLVTVMAGTEPQGITEFRYGSDLGTSGAWRISGKDRKTGDGETITSEDGNDGWEFGQLASRMDLAPSAQSAVSIQANIYGGTMGQSIRLPDATSPTLTRVIEEDADKRGGSILLRFEKDFDDGSALDLQTYYDRIKHEETVSTYTQDSLNIDLQYELPPTARHTVMCGVEARMDKTGFNDTEFVTWQKSDESNFMVSTFIQDRIDLLPKHLNLILGLRAEFNEVSGCELQPNARLLWAVTRNTSICLAASRASRMPSTGERNAVYLISYQDTGFPGVPPLPILVHGNRDLDPERVDTCEIGFRSTLTQQLSIDAAGFYSRYENLMADKISMTASGLPELILVNGMKAKTYGIELSSNYQATPDWRIQAAFSAMQMDLKLEDSSYEATIRSGDCPQNQASLFSTMNLPHNLEWNLWLRYVDVLPSQSVDAYLTLDTGLAWNARQNLTLSLVGRNLLEADHTEFNSEYLNVLSTEVERSFYGKVEWKF